MAKKIFTKPSQEALDLLRTCANGDPAIALPAQHLLAQGVGEVVRKGILDGDTIGGIFERIVLEPGAQANFPTDLMAPGSEARFIAFDLPQHGRVPERHVEADELLVKTFKVGNAIDIDIDYAEDARHDVVGRALEVLRDGFIQKNNTDGWTVILSCAADRAITIEDTAAGSGTFTKELAAKLKTGYLRNVGGNMTRGGLTDMYVSLEAIEDLRASTLTEFDDITRREILLAGENALPTLYGMVLHPLQELGVDQSYQTIYDSLGGSLGTDGAGDEELVIGLDLATNDSFKNPVRKDLMVFEDDALHRQQRMGWYAWMRHGFACLDNRRVIAGSF